MVVNCEQVWHEISNYIEGEVDAGLRSAMDEHFQTCKRCSSVLEGTRDVIRLYGDERMIEAPAGLGGPLGKKLAHNARARDGCSRVSSVSTRAPRPGPASGPGVVCRWSESGYSELPSENIMDRFDDRTSSFGGGDSEDAEARAVLRRRCGIRACRDQVVVNVVFS